MEKASHLLHLPEFDHGNVHVPLKLIQELRGNQQFWLAVIPSLGPLLQATNDLLGPPDEKGFARARGDAKGQKRIWERFWEAVEIQRLLVDNRAVWEARFTHPLLDALSVEEVLAIPAYRDRVVWASGDATLDMIAGIDWTAKKAFACSVEPLKHALNKFISDATGDDDSEDYEEGSGFIIAITEMLAVVCLASLRAHEWQGRMILYAGDNQTVIRWLERRQAGHAVAGYLIQILSALEAAGGFRVFGAFVRTYHNVTADSLTRENPKLVMEAKGLQELNGVLDSLRMQLDRGWQRRALIWAGQADADCQQALRLAERRREAGEIPRELETRSLLDLGVVELGCSRGPYARAGLSCGAEILQSTELGKGRTFAGPVGLFQSLPSVTNEDLDNLRRGVKLARPEVVWADCRIEESGKKVAEVLCALGLSTRVMQVSGRTLKDQSWWRRWVVLGVKRGDVCLPCSEASQEPQTPIPKFFPDWFACPDDEEAIQGTLQLDPSMPFLGATTPKPCGVMFVKGGDDAEEKHRKLVWDPSRPLPGLHPGSWDPQHKDPLLLYFQGKQGPQAKVITPQEVCLLLEGKVSPKDLDQAASAARSLLAAPPVSLVRLGLNWFGSHVKTEGKELAAEGEAVARFAPGQTTWDKAGLCPLPWEEHTEEVLLGWLREQKAMAKNAARVGGKKSRLSDEEKASKALSRILRHEAGTRECPISPEGWVKWQDILRHRLCRDMSEEILERGVYQNSKNRFIAKVDDRGEWYAAAWSGHTITGVTGPSHEAAPSTTPSVLVHGTYRAYVPAIQRKGLKRGRRDLHFQNPEEHAYRWRKDLEVKIVIDTRKAEALGCRFRKTGNLVWLCSQDVPPEAFVTIEEWDDLVGGQGERQQAGSSCASGAVEPRSEGLWEPKIEEWVKEETGANPVPITQDVVEVTQALEEAAKEVPPGTHLEVDPLTFATQVKEGAEPEEPACGDDCDWDPNTEDEVEVVQATAAKSVIEDDPVAKMEIEEDEPAPRRRKRFNLGSAQILLLQAIGDADAANWESLQQCIRDHGAQREDKSGLLGRLEQLAELRQVSREGAMVALQEERDRAWRVSRAENMYKAGLDEEMARLERFNPVAPRTSEPILTNARLQADIQAGVGIWRARRDHRARERAARHRRDQGREERTQEPGPLMDVDPREGGQALDDAMKARAKQELKDFRAEIRHTGVATGSGAPRSHQKDSQRRKKVKKQKALEKRKEGKKDPTGPEEKPEEGARGEVLARAPPEGDAIATELVGEVKREDQQAVSFGRGPMDAGTDVHRFDPVDEGQYAHWRTDLADSNGIALGDDEADLVLRQLQILIPDVDVLPPLYKARGSPVLVHKNGQPAQIQATRDFCVMVLEEGHWHGITCLKVPGEDRWCVSITGVQPEEDVTGWDETLATLSTIPANQLAIRTARDSVGVPGACGYAALISIGNQCTGHWDWDPLQAASYTADPVLDAKIHNHLTNLRNYLQANRAPLYYRQFVLQCRATFLKASFHQVIVRKVSMGRGLARTASRIATGPVSVAAVVLHEPGGLGDEEREEGETWVGYGILLALFCLLCWRASCICRRFREDLQGRSPRRDRKPSPSRRVGGTRKRVRFHSKLEDGAQGVSKVEFLGGPKTAKGLFPLSKPMRFSNIQGGQEWSQEGWALLLDRYSKSTMSVYKSQYKWWQLFCQRRGLDPVRYVTGYDRKEEDLFLEYMIRCAVNESKAPGTVKIRLAAIRSIHLSMGLPDPMANLPRIPLAMAGIKRRWGTKVRRKPVTPEMLEWIGQHWGYGKTQEGSLMFGAVCFGYFFLLRASEYLCVGYNQPEKGLRGQDVVLKAQGQECTLETIKEADEVILTIRGSKTDIYNRGEIRNHFRAEGNVCPVRAAIAIFLNFPQRYGGGNDALGPLFRTADDKLLPRGAVQAAIEAAAKALNMPPGDLGTHSLRFGGASAIWAAYGESALVKRWGRWASDSFQTYLWDAREASRDIAKRMATVDLTPA